MFCISADIRPPPFRVICSFQRLFLFYAFYKIEEFIDDA
ncbi:hypothetical protein D2M30_3763 [Bacillus amyloliquefaciens]|nr:hypothetical protein D2M30_3763 [Bacillus amyloliquefaciens]